MPDWPMKRWWYWPPWTLTNPVWPIVWFGGDEFGRRTLVIQPPLLGAFIFPITRPCERCARDGECPTHGMTPEDHRG